MTAQVPNLEMIVVPTERTVALPGIVYDEVPEQGDLPRLRGNEAISVTEGHALLALADVPADRLRFRQVNERCKPPWIAAGHRITALIPGTLQAGCHIMRYAALARCTVPRPRTGSRSSPVRRLPAGLPRHRELIATSLSCPCPMLLHPQPS